MTPEAYSRGTLKAGDQLVISCKSGFLKEDSYNQVYLLNETGKLTRITANDSDSYLRVGWSPDSTKLMITEVYMWAAWLYLATGDDYNLQEITPDNRYMQGLVWDPHSRYLLCVEQQTMLVFTSLSPVIGYHLYDTQTDTYRSITLNMNQCRDYVWLKEENALLLAGDHNFPENMNLKKYNFDTGVTTPLQADYLQEVIRFKFSPDGSRIAFTRRERIGKRWREVLYTVLLDGSEHYQVTPLHKYNIDGKIIWSPDSKKLALTDITPDDYGDGYSLYVVDIDGNNKRHLFLLNEGEDGEGMTPPSPAWSSDSQQIAIASSLDEGSAVFVMNADGSDLRQVTEATGLIFEVAWKPR